MQLYFVLHGSNSRELNVPKPGPTSLFLSKIVPCLMQEKLPIAVVWLEQVTWSSLGTPVPARQDLPCLTFGVVINSNCSLLAESVTVHRGSYGDSVMTVKKKKIKRENDGKQGRGIYLRKDCWFVYLSKWLFFSTIWTHIYIFVLHSQAEKECKIPESRLLFLRLLAVTDCHSL